MLKTFFRSILIGTFIFPAIASAEQSSCRTSFTKVDLSLGLPAGATEIARAVSEDSRTAWTTVFKKNSSGVTQLYFQQVDLFSGGAIDGFFVPEIRYGIDSVSVGLSVIRDNKMLLVGSKIWEVDLTDRRLSRSREVLSGGKPLVFRGVARSSGNNIFAYSYPSRAHDSGKLAVIYAPNFNVSAIIDIPDMLLAMSGLEVSFDDVEVAVGDAAKIVVYSNGAGFALRRTISASSVGLSSFSFFRYGPDKALYITGTDSSTIDGERASYPMLVQVDSIGRATSKIMQLTDTSPQYGIALSPSDPSAMVFSNGAIYQAGLPLLYLLGSVPAPWREGITNGVTFTPDGQIAVIFAGTEAIAIHGFSGGMSALLNGSGPLSEGTMMQIGDPNSLEVCSPADPNMNVAFIFSSTNTAPFITAANGQELPCGQSGKLDLEVIRALDASGYMEEPRFAAHSRKGSSVYMCAVTYDPTEGGPLDNPHSVSSLAFKLMMAGD